MMDPDFPMTPPTREAWQRSRNTTRLGNGGERCELLLLLLFAAAAAAAEAVEELGTEAATLFSCI